MNMQFSTSLSAEAERSNSSVDRWTNEGGATPRSPDEADRKDLNQLLSAEQIAIMRAGLAPTEAAQAQHEDSAHDLRRTINTMAYPSRGPHVFPTVTNSKPAHRIALRDVELAALQVRVAAMEQELAQVFSEGLIGTGSNTFEHRSRLIRQARQAGQQEK